MSDNGRSKDFVDEVTTLMYVQCTIESLSQYENCCPCCGKKHVAKTQCTADE